MRVIIDVNIWVSFCIGQHLDDLSLALSQPAVELFICEALESEFADVVSRPRLAKYIRQERVVEVFQLMEAYGISAEIEWTEANFVDANDNYLLDFSRSVRAEYLVTGDQGLLALGNYVETKIISFREFIRMLKTEP